MWIVKRQHLTCLVMVAAMVFSNSEQTKAAEPAWGEPIDGVQYRLTASRSEWASWEQPELVLEFKNVTQDSIPAEKFIDRFGSKSDNLQFLQSLGDEPAGRKRLKHEVEVVWDIKNSKDVEAGKIYRAPLRVKRLHYWSRSVTEFGISSGNFKVGLGSNPRDPVFHTGLVAITILPPDVPDKATLDKQLRKYQFDGKDFRAGFVCRQEFLEGEPVLAYFIVANPNKQPLQFSFGGDYRASHRHDRFKVTGTDPEGNELKDPSSGMSMGGLLWPRVVMPENLIVEEIEFEKFRKLTGPGEYKSKIHFLFENDFLTAEQRKGVKPVDIANDLQFTVLPRNPKRIAGRVSQSVKNIKLAHGNSRKKLISELTALAGEAAVDSLKELGSSGTLDQRRDAVEGLGQVKHESAMRALLDFEKVDALRADALIALGSFANEQAMQRTVESLRDSNDAIRAAGANALGRMSSESAADALTAALSDASEMDQIQLIAAMGATKQSKLLKVVADHLHQSNSTAIREAALKSITGFQKQAVADHLKEYLDDDDLDFREQVAQVVAEKLRLPIDTNSLVPVVQSRNGQSSLGHSITLIRLYGEQDAATCMMECLDFKNPKVRNYYNLCLIQNQFACRNGLAVDWIGDLNRNGTRSEITKNNKTLNSIRRWLDEYKTQPWVTPNHRDMTHDDQKQTWGKEVAGFKIRATTNNAVWPHDMPQVLIINLMHSNGGSANLNEAPKVVHIELDGDLYEHDSAKEIRVVGDWHAYKGHRFQAYQLGENWKRVSDGQPMKLTAGDHIARISITPPQASDPDKMITSQEVKFRVLGAE